MQTHRKARDAPLHVEKLRNVQHSPAIARDVTFHLKISISIQRQTFNFDKCFVLLYATDINGWPELSFDGSSLFVYGNSRSRNYESMTLHRSLFLSLVALSTSPQLDPNPQSVPIANNNATRTSSLPLLTKLGLNVFCLCAFAMPNTYMARSLLTKNDERSSSWQVEHCYFRSIAHRYCHCCSVVGFENDTFSDVVISTEKCTK